MAGLALGLAACGGGGTKLGDAAIDTADQRAAIAIARNTAADGRFDDTR